MLRVYPYQGVYGEPRRNEPVHVPAANPLPENKMSSNTGDAGRDGYTVMSRADRYTGLRPSIEGTPDCQGPNMAQEQ